MTVLPVTTTVAGSTFSASRLALLVAVGARCRVASWVASRRLISSGYGEYGSSVRRPASRCTTGIFS